MACYTFFIYVHIFIYFLINLNLISDSINIVLFNNLPAYTIYVYARILPGLIINHIPIYLYVCVIYILASIFEGHANDLHYPFECKRTHPHTCNSTIEKKRIQQSNFLIHVKLVLLSKNERRN